MSQDIRIWLTQAQSTRWHGTDIQERAQMRLEIRQLCARRARAMGQPFATVVDHDGRELERVFCAVPFELDAHQAAIWTKGESPESELLHAQVAELCRQRLTNDVEVRWVDVYGPDGRRLGRVHRREQGQK